MGYLYATLAFVTHVVSLSLITFCEVKNRVVRRYYRHGKDMSLLYIFWDVDESCQFSVLDEHTEIILYSCP